MNTPMAHSQRTGLEAVVSAIPTLIMSGSDDPITPPIYGSMVARALSRSYRLVFPGMAHGTAFGAPCPTNIMTAFVHNPMRKPDTRCIGHMSESSFGALGT